MGARNQLLAVIVAAALSACSSSGTSTRVVHYGVGYGGGWGPWGGYYERPVYIPIDVGPELPDYPEFEATPLPEIPDDF